MKKSTKIRKYLRLIHRDLGYLFVGISLVYAFSGIVLNHKKSGEDPVYSTVEYKETIAANLTNKNIETYWVNNYPDIILKRIVKKNSNYKLYIKAGAGYYYPASGELKFEIYKRNDLYYFVTKLHYNSQKGWMYMADVFAVALIIFALSGMFMVPGKNGLKGRGKYLVILGIIIPFLFFL